MTATQRKSLTVYRGVVSRRSGDKTIRVELNYLSRHPLYGKAMRRRTIALVHDEKNVAKAGDTVEITKCRPLSKNKSWRLLQVLESGS